jgi:hypothetical protein
VCEEVSGAAVLCCAVLFCVETSNEVVIFHEQLSRVFLILIFITTTE